MLYTNSPQLLVASRGTERVKHVLGCSNDPFKLRSLEVGQERIRGEAILDATNERLDTSDKELHGLSRTLDHIASTLLFPFL